jgi:hypothetical protein
MIMPACVALRTYDMPLAHAKCDVIHGDSAAHEKVDTFPL